MSLPLFIYLTNVSKFDILLTLAFLANAPESPKMTSDSVRFIFSKKIAQIKSTQRIKKLQDYHKIQKCLIGNYS